MVELWCYALGMIKHEIHPTGSFEVVSHEHDCIIIDYNANSYDLVEE